MTPDLQRLGEVTLAMILGGLIGAERDLADEPDLATPRGAKLTENRIRRARLGRPATPV